MSERRLIDTNLIVRHLVQDHEKQARIAGKLFDACDRGEVVIVVLPEVLAECVFVLDSFYERSRASIVSVLDTLISGRGVEMNGAAIHREALELYRKTNLHFVDCVLAASAAADNSPVATFDQELRKLPGIRVENQ